MHLKSTLPVDQSMVVIIDDRGTKVVPYDFFVERVILILVFA